LDLFTHAVAAIDGKFKAVNARTSKSENKLAQKALVRELEIRKVPHFLGHGADPLGKWPAEESRLVLGIELDEAAALGRRFGQNGFVWAANDALPMLVLLRRPLAIASVRIVENFPFEQSIAHLAVRRRAGLQPSGPRVARHRRAGLRRWTCDGSQAPCR
jgi:hypothetical protein